MGPGSASQAAGRREERQRSCGSPIAGSNTSTSSTLSTPIASVASPPPTGKTNSPPPCIPSAQQSTGGRRPLCSVVIKLPDGVITEVDYEGTARGCYDATEELRDEKSSLALMTSLRPGRSLLALLQGKGAQTLMLNAYCGHAKRRMYARLSSSVDGASFTPCELLCEFLQERKDGPTVRTARIQICPLESTLRFTTLNPTPHSTEPLSATTTNLAFTTRHNASCALVYIDSSSIPLLGHFPSEITGQSVFALLHPGDVELLRRVHEELHHNYGFKLVSTTSIRFLCHDQRSVCTVDSEWSAYVNPWSRQIEMIVGKHAPTAIVPATSADCTLVCHERAELRSHDETIRRLLSKPVSSYSPEVIELERQETSCGLHNKADPSFGDCVDELLEKLLNETGSRPSGADRHGDEEAAPRTTLPTLPVQDSLLLSYNQINCLENVHRLLLSQAVKQSSNVYHSSSNGPRKSHRTKSYEATCPANVPIYTKPTRELLQIHNRRWEEDCKDEWKKRLSTGGPTRAQKREAASIGGGDSTRVSKCVKRDERHATPDAFALFEQTSTGEKLQQQSSATTAMLRHNYVLTLQSILSRHAAAFSTRPAGGM